MYKDKYIKYKTKYNNLKNNKILQQGGFIGSILSAAKGVWKIKIKVNEFKLIAETIQEIVRDSFKPNGLYDITIVCSAMADPLLKQKIETIIEKYHLPLGELDQLTFLQTAKELKKERREIGRVGTSLLCFLHYGLLAVLLACIFQQEQLL